MSDQNASQLTQTREMVSVLGKALVTQVGTKDQAELDEMEAVLRSVSIPDADRATAIDSINAVRKLLEYEAALAASEQAGEVG